MRKIKNIIKDLSIRNKYLFACIPVICIVVAMILLTTTRILYSSNIKKAKEITSEENKIIGVRMDSMRKNVKTCLNITTKDISNIYENVDIDHVNEVSFIEVKNNIYTFLDYNMRCFSDVTSLIFIDIKGNIVYTGCDQDPEKEIIIEEMIHEIPARGLPTEIQYSMAVRKYMGSGTPMLSFGKRIIGMKSGADIGYLFLNISEESISKIFPNYNDEEAVLEQEYYITDENRVVVSSLDKNKLFYPIEGDIDKHVKGDAVSEMVNLSGTDYLITSEWLEGFRWTLISQISRANITKDIRIASVITVFWGLMGIVMAIILIWILSDILVRPLRILTQNTEQVKNGNFDIIVIQNAKDEVGILAGSFDTMIKKINQLLKQVKEEQQQKRKYELALIQEQIKPHFLYNTLDLIYIFCVSDMSEKGGDLTKVLADYYRGVLSNGKEIVTIAQEFNNIQNYLYIQQERYCDMLEFYVFCDARIEAYSIVKMTLQPLVENAIYHGIKGREKKGMIKVTGTLEMDAVRLCVEDDGVGMSAERMEEILKEDGKEYREHFGVKSVNRRIKLYYGEEYGLKIISEVNKGTKVIIRIPKQLMEEGKK